jgi:exodeoxyribonuclease III
MKIITLNTNGIRSAQRKGFFGWMQRQHADVICLQETKAQVHQLDEQVLAPAGYYGFFNDAEKKGYSGVALYTRKQPDRIIYKLGWTVADVEGRYLQVDFGKLSIVSVYLPSGSSSEERQSVKFDFMDRFMPALKKMRKQEQQYILCGDWNIAHKEIDLQNWRGNRKNSGFLPQERAWLDELFNEVGMVDAFRVINQEEHQYTWWSNRGQAWSKNVGWRIDYQIISPELKTKVVSADIYKSKRFSDHAPLIMEYSIPF